VVLLFGIGVAAVCGLVYELAAGALSSYLLGSSIVHFSLVIGVFMCAMGVGSYLSQHVKKHLISAFVTVEVLVGLIGGMTGLVGFVAFAYTQIYHEVLFGFVIAVGILIGYEVPLVIRILRTRSVLRVSVANVMAADYAGALAASVLFPFVLVPHVGLVLGSLLVGLANVGVGWVIMWVLRREIHPSRKVGLIVLASVATVTLIVSAALSQNLSKALQRALFQDKVFYEKETPYQHLVLTRWKDDVRLFINGALQFASADEYRYHESLVHPTLAAQPLSVRVLVLGGGDGMAVREILKYPKVEHVDLVDLDPEMTRIFREKPELSALNGESLSDKRVTVHNMDALKFLDKVGASYDAVIIDLPDPNNLDLSKLYSVEFYRLIQQRLGHGGVLVTQATSPFHTRDAFWCIAHTLKASGMNTYPYTAYVPSFGQWGFVMASKRPLDPSTLSVRVETKHLTDALMRSLFVFGKDTAEVETPANHIDDHPLVRLYAEGYSRYFE